MRPARRPNHAGVASALHRARVVIGVLLAVGPLGGLVGPAAAGPVRAPAGIPVPIASTVAPPVGVIGCLSSACGGGGGAAGGFVADLARPAVPLALGSTDSNWFVSNWSGEGMIAENPRDPANLVAGGLYQYPSSTNSTVFYTSGVSGVSTSFDGGRSWSTQTLPASPDWSNRSRPQCSHIHLADTAIVFGPNDTAYYLDLSYYEPKPGLSCSGGLAGTGLYLTRSLNGGRSWEAPIGVAGMNAGGSIDKPWMAIDPDSGRLYVAYTDDGNSSVIELQHSNDSGLSWSAPLDISSGGPTSGSMRGVELAVDRWGGIDAAWINQNNAQIQFTRSTDGGRSFGRPVAVATAASEYTSPSPDAFRAYTLPGFGVDRSNASPYSGRDYVIWQDGGGGSAGTPAVSLSYSADNGSHWSTTVRVNSDSRLENFQPDVAVTSDGTVYAEWYGEDPSSGHYRLYATASHDGGAHFDAEIPVSDVDSFPQYSSSGGGHAWWIGDYTHALADANGVRALWTDARARQAWSCSPCLWGYVYNISFYTAEVTSATLRASLATNLSLNGSVPGPSAVAVRPTPGYREWLIGQQYTLTAPAVADAPAGPRYFALWFGDTITTNATVNGTVQGPVHLTACYADAPGGPCTMPGAPGRWSISVVPANATVLLNDRALPLDASGAFSAWASPGNYTLAVSAPGYHPWNATETITPGNTTSVRIALQVITGALVARVTPAEAWVALTPVQPLVPLGLGYYQATLAPGNYELTCTLQGYATALVPISIVADTTIWTNVTLVPEPGWINGTVVPATAAVQLNGAPIALGAGGTFAQRMPPGTYWINATAPGREATSSGPLTVESLGAMRILLWLPRTNGSLNGTVTPATATVRIDGTSVAAVSGQFAASLAPGPHALLVEAWGYAPFAESVTIAGNLSSSVAVTLPVAPGWLQATVDPADARVQLDGVPAYVTASGAVNRSLTAGPHELVATAAGYQRVTLSVSVQPGRATEVNVLLPPEPAGSGPAIVLDTGLGVGAVAVAAVLAVWVVRRSSARRRRPTPSRRRTDGDGPA